jgi:hypothetical protein
MATSGDSKHIPFPEEFRMKPGTNKSVEFFERLLSWPKLKDIHVASKETKLEAAKELATIVWPDDPSAELRKYPVLKRWYKTAKKNNKMPTPADTLVCIMLNKLQRDNVASVHNEMEDICQQLGTTLQDCLQGVRKTPDYVPPSITRAPKNTGAKDLGKKDSGKKDSGKKDSGKKDSGKKDSGKKDSGNIHEDKSVTRTHRNIFDDPDSADYDEDYVEDYDDTDRSIIYQRDSEKDNGGGFLGQSIDKKNRKDIVKRNIFGQMHKNIFGSDDVFVSPNVSQKRKNEAAVEDPLGSKHRKTTQDAESTTLSELVLGISKTSQRLQKEVDDLKKAMSNQQINLKKVEDAHASDIAALKARERKVLAFIRTALCKDADISIEHLQKFDNMLKEMGMVWVGTEVKYQD